MNKLTNPAPIEAAALLDHLAHAANTVVRMGDDSEAASYFLRAMSERERVAFDLFLVATKDPLAYEAGTAEHRFQVKVAKMAEQFIEWKQSLEARRSEDNSIAGTALRAYEAATAGGGDVSFVLVSLDGDDKPADVQTYTSKLDAEAHAETVVSWVIFLFDVDGVPQVWKTDRRSTRDLVDGEADRLSSAR